MLYCFKKRVEVLEIGFDFFWRVFIESVLGKYGFDVFYWDFLVGLVMIMNLVCFKDFDDFYLFVIKFWIEFFVFGFCVR